MVAGGVRRRVLVVVLDAGVRGLGGGVGDIAGFVFDGLKVKSKLKLQVVDGRVGDEVGTFASRWESGGGDVGEDRRGEEESGEGFTGV
jgi:hypothetical protein